MAKATFFTGQVPTAADFNSLSQDADIIPMIDAKALLAGSPTQVFSVANGTGSQAINKTQADAAYAAAGGVTDLNVNSLSAVDGARTVLLVQKQSGTLPAVKIDGGAITNAPALLLDNVGAATAQISMQYASGGSLAWLMGYVAPVSYATTNRVQAFVVGGNVYSGSYHDAFNFSHNTSASDTTMAVVGMTGQTGSIVEWRNKSDPLVMLAKVEADGSVVSTRKVRTGVFTAATLPAGVVGDRAFVSDALTQSFGAVVAGGGAIGTPVYYDGTNWRIG